MALAKQLAKESTELIRKGIGFQSYAPSYFFTKLEITKFVSGLLYFGYMSIAALVFFVSTGTIGFYACYWFVWKIFSAIKVD